MKMFLRRIKHFIKSGCVVLGIEHFLVMFPSALLIAKIASLDNGEPVIGLSTILFACGFGTLVFILVTKGKIPFFLGPSFAYIGFTSYYVSLITTPSDMVGIRQTIFWGYLLAAIILVVISRLYRFQKVRKMIRFLFPNVVMGPAISLIGLELADLAVADAGFTEKDGKEMVLALITLAVTILASLIKRRFLKNSSVFLGVVVGCVFAGILGFTNWSDVFQNTSFWNLPTIEVRQLLKIPSNLPQLFLAVMPCAIVAFTESLGRIEVLSGMQKRDKPTGKYVDSQMPYHTLKAHGIANMISIISGVLPNAIYAENLAIMNLNNAELSTRNRLSDDKDEFVVDCYALYSIYPYVVAAALSIVVACFGGLQKIFVAIPKPVLGGVELFVFGLIAAPGIQLLVEQKVNYKKISNQIITASILLAGVSNLTISFKTIELKGMSLGLIIGVALNLLTKLLAFLGMLNERMSLIEVLDECLMSFQSRVSLRMRGNTYFSGKQVPYTVEELKIKIRENGVYDMLKAAEWIELKDEKTSKEIKIQQSYDKIIIMVSVKESARATLCNDYDNIIPCVEDGQVQIVVSSHMSTRMFREIMRNAI